MPSFDPTTPSLTVLFSTLLLAVGIGIVVYLLFLVFSAFSYSFGGLFERAAFRRHSIRCARGDEFLERGDFARAVQLFGGAFFLKPIRYDSALLADVGNYHTGLLSRLLTVADEMGKGRARLPSLVETDRLLAERLEIHLDYFRALKKEDSERVRESRDRLRENGEQVRTAIDRLINEIRLCEERVLYH
jgi:hypothetical protein